MLLKIKADIAADARQQFCNCASGLIMTQNDEAEKAANTLETMMDKLDGTASSEPALSGATCSLKTLHRLKTFKMEACVNISDRGLSSGINLHRLHELDIKLCTNVTGSFVDSDQNRPEQFSNLRSLNLNQCTAFAEENLYRIIESAPNLKELSMSAVPSVRNRMVEVLLEKKRLLTLLDVSFCSEINESEIMKYEQFLYGEFGSREFNLDRRFITK